MRRACRRRSAAATALWLGLVSPLAASAEEPASGAETLNPLHGLAKDTLSGFRDRPLFNPNRAEPRAPEAAPAIVAPPPGPVVEPPPAIRLVGIVSGPQTLAMVRPTDGGRTILLATGDKLGAWTATVSAEGLTLQNAAQSVAFGLFQRGNAAGQGSAAGATATTGDPAPP